MRPGLQGRAPTALIVCAVLVVDRLCQPLALPQHRILRHFVLQKATCQHPPLPAACLPRVFKNEHHGSFWRVTAKRRHQRPGHVIPSVSQASDTLRRLWPGILGTATAAKDAKDHPGFPGRLRKLEVCILRPVRCMRLSGSVAKPIGAWATSQRCHGQHCREPLTKVAVVASKKRPPFERLQSLFMPPIRRARGARRRGEDHSIYSATGHCKGRVMSSCRFLDSCPHEQMPEILRNRILPSIEPAKLQQAATFRLFPSVLNLIATATWSFRP